jgi:hypothetical protein
LFDLQDPFEVVSVPQTLNRLIISAQITQVSSQKDSNIPFVYFSSKNPKTLLFSMEVMGGPEEYVVTTGCDGDAVLIDMDPNLPDAVAEEVVIDPSGGSSESVHFYQCQQEGVVEGIDAGSIVEVKEEEISYDDGSEEMSVAIDLAKLSQGHFSQRDRIHQSGEYKLMSDQVRFGIFSSYSVSTINLSSLNFTFKLNLKV